MAVLTPINPVDLDFDNGSFDSAGFAALALSNWQALAAVLDHTLLKPDATARRWRASAMRPPATGSPAPWSTRYGLDGREHPFGNRHPHRRRPRFPFGASLVSTLLQEAAALTRLGARELDMVIPSACSRAATIAPFTTPFTPRPRWLTITARSSK